MYTIKIYADGHTFIRSAVSVEIIHYESGNWRELCDSLKKDYVDSGVLDDKHWVSGVSIQDQKEECLEEMMPHTFMFYESEGESCKWLFHGDDTAYIVNEQGKTIERIKFSGVMTSFVEDETSDKNAE